VGKFFSVELWGIICRVRKKKVFIIQFCVFLTGGILLTYGYGWLTGFGRAEGLVFL